MPEYIRVKEYCKLHAPEHPLVLFHPHHTSRIFEWGGSSWAITGKSDALLPFALKEKDKPLFSLATGEEWLEIVSPYQENQNA